MLIQNCFFNAYLAEGFLVFLGGIKREYWPEMRLITNTVSVPVLISLE